jgi:hypothetical protein
MLRAFGGEGAPETTSVRITKNQSICYAPEYVAEEFLRDEGFTDIRFVDTPPPEIGAAIGWGKVAEGQEGGRPGDPVPCPTSWSC